MIPPALSVTLTRQLKDCPPAIKSCLQGSEWVSSTFILPSSPLQEQQGLQFPGVPSQHPSHSFLHISNNYCLDPHFPDTSLYSAPVSQVNLDSVYAKDQSLVFLGYNPSFDSNVFDSGFTSINPTQYDIPWTTPGSQYDLGLGLAEGLAVNNVAQTSDEVPGYFTPSTFVLPPTSYAANLHPQITTLDQVMEASLQTMHSDAFSSVDMSLPVWGSGQPIAHRLVENPSNSNLACLAAGIYSSLYPRESSQEVDYEAVQSSPDTARPRFEQQSMLSERPVGPCKWQDVNGTVCGEVLTRASLPEHLSTHGIRKMSRDRLLKCNWVGCRRKSPMNRESIVRHIREVHLGLKRPPTRM